MYVIGAETFSPLKPHYACANIYAPPYNLFRRSRSFIYVKIPVGTSKDEVFKLAHGPSPAPLFGAAGKKGWDQGLLSFHFM